MINFGNLRFFPRLVSVFLITLSLFLTAFAVAWLAPERQWLIIALLLAGMAMAAICVLTFKSISKKLRFVTEAAHKLSEGDFPSLLPSGGTDELSALSGKLNLLTENLKTKNEFISRLGAGDLAVTYQAMNGHDSMAEALLGIRENLVRVKSEEQQRTWTSDALAKFVEILRTNKGFRELCNDVIVNLVKILRANQGAIFVAAKDEASGEYLNMEACYAYERTKFMTKRIGLGEGLVGQAYLEQDTIYLKKVPENFVRITSGLGDAPPTNILIIPLKMNETMVGVVELAAFHEFSQHEIEFAEKIGENIAHTITSFRIAENTRTLLNESEQRAEQMRAQEEELRQNQEELQATQEEISRKYQALFGQLTVLNNDSKFDQLLSITYAKKRNIEYYFEVIRNQIITFSEDRMVLFATKALRNGFAAVDPNIAEEKFEEMQLAVRKYYDDEFISRLNHNLAIKAKALDYYPKEKKAVQLQYLYLSQNPHPTGKKSLLDNPGDGGDYSKAHATYHPPLRSYLEKFGYYDIFIIDPNTGEIVYSVAKEIDYGTNMISGLYSGTNFGRAVKEAMASTDKGFVKLIDFETYEVSYGVPAAFIVRPIYEANEKIGIIVFQISVNRLNTILTGDNHWREDGLGRTGESFMVGSDFKLRSVTRGLIENPDTYLEQLRRQGYDDQVVRQIQTTGTNILREKMNLDCVRNAFGGQAGRHLEKNANGVKCLYTYAPLNIPDVNWVIVSCLTEEESLERIERLKNI